MDFSGLVAAAASIAKAGVSLTTLGLASRIAGKEIISIAYFAGASGLLSTSIGLSYASLSTKGGVSGLSPQQAASRKGRPQAVSQV